MHLHLLEIVFRCHINASAARNYAQIRGWCTSANAADNATHAQRSPVYKSSPKTTHTPFHEATVMFLCKQRERETDRQIDEE